MKQLINFFGIFLVTVVVFNSCSTQEEGSNSQEIILNEVDPNLFVDLEIKPSQFKSFSIPLCIPHGFTPQITNDYSVSTPPGSNLSLCVANFDLGSISVLQPTTVNTNLKFIIQIIENPIDHPDGFSGGETVVHNLVSDFNSQINDSFDIVHFFGQGNPPIIPTFGFIVGVKRLKVSFGVFEQSIIGNLCTPFRSENVFFTSVNDCVF